MADRIYAGIGDVKPARVDAMVDRAVRETRRKQLLPTHDPMLLRGELGGCGVSRHAPLDPHLMASGCRTDQSVGRVARCVCVPYVAAV